MRSVEEYMALPYTMVVVPDQDEEGRSGWVAEVEELPGCVSQGATPGEAVERVRDGMAGWLSVAVEDGLTIPEPRVLEDYSGRFLVRVPSSLHADLVVEADREGVSLNQFVTNALAGAVGWRRENRRAPRPRRAGSRGVAKTPNG